MLRTFRNLGSLMILALIASVPSAFAQTGPITETIKDQSGAMLPAVSVNVTNTGTKESICIRHKEAKL